MVLDYPVSKRINVYVIITLLHHLQCKDICTDVQDSLLHDVKELNEQSKAYQYSCLNCSDAYGKLGKAREKLQKASAKRKDKREEQEKEVCVGVSGVERCFWPMARGCVWVLWCMS